MRQIMYVKFLLALWAVFLRRYTGKRPISVKSWRANCLFEPSKTTSSRRHVGFWQVWEAPTSLELVVLDKGAISTGIKIILCKLF